MRSRSFVKSRRSAPNTRSPARFDTTSTLQYSASRANSRSKAVAVLREARIDSRLQYMQNALLNEPVEDGRDPELSDSTATLWNRVPSHWLRPVAPSEEILTYARPVRRQIRWQLVHRHPVDAGTALVLLYPPKRRFDVAACDD